MWAAITRRFFAIPMDEAARDDRIDRLVREAMPCGTGPSHSSMNLSQGLLAA